MVRPQCQSHTSVRKRHGSLLATSELHAEQIWLTPIFQQYLWYSHSRPLPHQSQKWITTEVYPKRSWIHSSIRKPIHPAKSCTFCLPRNIPTKIHFSVNTSNSGTLDLNEWKKMCASSVVSHDLIKAQRIKPMIDFFWVKMDWEITSCLLHFTLQEAEASPPSHN